MAAKSTPGSLQLAPSSCASPRSRLHWSDLPVGQGPTLAWLASTPDRSLAAQLEEHLGLFLMGSNEAARNQHSIFRRLSAIIITQSLSQNGTIHLFCSPQSAW